METIFLLTKDCMPTEALPCYGGCAYWQGKTPNIDELAEKGLMFMRHYTAAPSTSMAMSAMLTGHYPYEFLSRKHYVGVSPSEFPSIFDDFQKDGYECHLIWDKTWIQMAWKFVREFGDESRTKIHNLDIAQATAAYKPGNVQIKRNDLLLQETLSQIYNTLNNIDFSQKQFVWLHLPHILKGRRAYMDDMDVFDEIVGFVRNLVGDENVFLSSDHGHMNLHKHKIRYGFDVYESAVRIPFITPRLKNAPSSLKKVDYLTSNVDLPSILLTRSLPSPHDYVLSDTKYYAQKGRKVGVIGDKYKYIYNGANHEEELYDLKWDPQEEFNILETLIYDVDRKIWSFTMEHYFYPYYEEALKELERLRNVKDEIWRYPTTKERLYVNLYDQARKSKTLGMVLKLLKRKASS